MQKRYKIIRFFVLVLTSVGGMMLSILTPAAMMHMAVPEIADHYVLWVWVCMGIFGYLVPCVLMMLELIRTAAGFSVIGTVLALWIDRLFQQIAETGIVTSPRGLYLMQIFMTILLVLYTVLRCAENGGRPRKADAKAPSILGDASNGKKR